MLALPEMVSGCLELDRELGLVRPAQLGQRARKEGGDHPGIDRRGQLGESWRPRWYSPFFHHRKKQRRSK